MITEAKKLEMSLKLGIPKETLEELEELNKHTATLAKQNRQYKAGAKADGSLERLTQSVTSLQAQIAKLEASIGSSSGSTGNFVSVPSGIASRPGKSKRVDIVALFQEKQKSTAPNVVQLLGMEAGMKGVA